MVKVTRDGKTFDIDDSEESLSAAKAKGYSPLLTVTKNGKDTFDLNADDVDSVKAAFNKGYMELNAFSNSKKPKAEHNPLLSVAQGAAETMSFGLDDEIGGFLTAAAKGVTGNGYEYSKERDKIRSSKKELEEANPNSYLAGSLAGGLVAPGGAAAKVGTGLLKRAGIGAATGAAQGGLEGFGSSEAEGFGEQLGDAVKGAAVGGLLGGGIGAVVKPSALKGELGGMAEGAIESASPYAKGAGAAFKEGAKKGKEVMGLDISSIPIASQASQVGSGVIHAAKELLNTKFAINEQRKLAQKAISEGGQPWPGFSQNMSDVDVIASRAMGGGEYNSVADWISKEAANFGIPEDDYKKLLKMTPERLEEVANFSKREAADDAAPLFQSLKDTFENVRTNRMKELKKQARAEFKLDVDPVLKSIQDSYASASELKTTTGAQKALSDVYEILNGAGSKTFGFEPGRIQDVDTATMFDRLQAARSHLDDNIDWTAIKKGNRSPTPVEKTLMKVRQDLDRSLKGGSDSKVESDSLFRASKDLENRFFKLAEDKDGEHGVSLAKLFGDNDRAVKAKSFLKEVEDFAQRKDLPDSMRESTKALADNLRSAMDTASDKRIYQEFSRKTRGPTGPSVERNANIMGKRNIAQQALVSPSTYLDLKVAMPGLAKERFGKTYSDLNQFEQQALLTFVGWKQGRILQGDPLTPQIEAATWQKILENIKK